MSRVNVTLTENPLARTGVSTDVGAFFAVVQTDEGPTTVVKCNSLTDVTNTYGAWSTTNAIAYNAAAGFFSTNAGSPAFLVRCSDVTAASATLTLNDASSHPTVTITALTPGVDGNEIHVEVSGLDVLILDASGDVLETHPFVTNNSELLAASSAYVTFIQATGSGHTSAVPATLASTALSGGANPSDINDAALVASLASFTPEMGPGTVSIPGGTSSTIAQGVFAHALANNRFAVVEQADATTSTSAISALTALDIPTSASKAGVVVQGSPIFPVNGTTGRVYPASGVVAGLRDRATAGGSNPPPAFSNGQLPLALGFTTAFNNVNNTTDPAYVGTFAQADADAMTAAGLCFFGWDPNPCLDEFVTPDVDDDIFFQGTAWSAAMILVSQCQSVGQQFKGVIIDGQNSATTAFHSALNVVIQNMFTNNVLFGDNVNDAASIATGPPVNTPATAAAGELNADIAAKFAPYADQVNISILVNSLTQSVGASS